jgi:hypothetical protein
MNNISAISWQEQVTWDDADDGQLCTRPTHLVGFLLCKLTETTVCGQTCPSTLTHYSDSEPASFCSCFILLCAWRRDNKYQIYSLWFDPYGAWTHDLPHSRRAH